VRFLSLSFGCFDHFLAQDLFVDACFFRRSLLPFPSQPQSELFVLSKFAGTLVISCSTLHSLDEFKRLSDAISFPTIDESDISGGMF